MMYLRKKIVIYFVVRLIVFIIVLSKGVNHVIMLLKGIKQFKLYYYEKSTLFNCWRLLLM